MKILNSFPTTKIDPPAWAEINLSHLKNNLQIVRQLLDPKTQIIAVVKADSYGHGAVEMINCLIQQGVHYFAVANVEEGVDLRNAGINEPILILGFSPSEQAHKIVENHLTPTVCTLPFAFTLAEAARVRQQQIKIHIRVDVSSGSLGISPDECASFVKSLLQLKWLEIEGIFTHLASAYGGERSDIQKDIHRFNDGINAIREMGKHIPMVHAASSPSIVNVPDALFNTVRPGIILYGLPALEDEQDIGLQPIMQIKAKIVYIKDVELSVGLGYGYRYRSDSNTRLAMIPLGYADCAFLHHLREGEVLIQGTRAPIMGQVYMDHFWVNITHLPEAETGDEVVILGNQDNTSIRAQEIALKANIGEMNCDIVTLLGHRVPRIYI